MLTTALKLTIDSLQHPERLLAYLDELGRRHAHYGVQPRHLGLMGKALMEVLPSVDPEWTDSTAHAWASAYGHIAQLIQRGIENVRTSQQLPLGAVRRAFWEVPLFALRPTGFSAPTATWHSRVSATVPSTSSSRGVGLEPGAAVARPARGDLPAPLGIGCARHAVRSTRLRLVFGQSRPDDPGSAGRPIW